MKKLIVFIIISAFLLSISSAFADQWVNGHSRRDGTYVPGHYRSNNDGNFNNNYSTQGNYNPYTGKRGYRKRYY